MFVWFRFWLILPLVIVYTEDLYSKFYQHDYHLEFTRLELADYNQDFFEYYKVVTFKYNRSVAVANITFKTKIAADNKNMQVIAQVYKFYSNEYRTFPIRLQLNFCTCIKNNLLGTKTSFTSCGNYSTDCYFTKGEIYHTCNLVPDPSRFPPMIPNGQYKLELAFELNNTIVTILNGYGTINRLTKFKM